MKRIFLICLLVFWLIVSWTAVYGGDSYVIPVKGQSASWDKKISGPARFKLVLDDEAVLDRMLPYLLCLNLNGMNEGAAPKILAVGKGKHEANMIQTVIESGYSGPIGILDHQNHRDTKEVLLENLEGLEKILSRLK